SARAYRCAGLLEPAAAKPQFAVHRDGGPALGKPAGRGDQVAATRPQLLAVPVPADTIELLAYPVLAYVNPGLVAGGEHQWRRGGWAGRCNREGQAQQQQADRTDHVGLVLESIGQPPSWRGVARKRNSRGRLRSTILIVDRRAARTRH